MVKQMKQRKNFSGYFACTTQTMFIRRDWKHFRVHSVGTQEPKVKSGEEPSHCARVVQGPESNKPGQSIPGCALCEGVRRGGQVVCRHIHAAGTSLAEPPSLPAGGE